MPISILQFHRSFLFRYNSLSLSVKLTCAAKLSKSSAVISLKQIKLEHIKPFQVLVMYLFPSISVNIKSNY